MDQTSEFKRHINVQDFEIETEELKLFDLSFMEVEQFFLGYTRPLNVYLQYLYGWMLTQRSKHQMLEKFLESVYHADINLLLKCHLSLIHPKYGMISASLWKDLEAEFFHNPLLQAEQLNLLGVFYQSKNDLSKAVNYFSKAQELFETFGLNRRVLRCECSICDLNKKLNPSFDAHTAWADIIFKANKIGDRSIYMSALSKLSFSL